MFFYFQLIAIIRVDSTRDADVAVGPIRHLRRVWGSLGQGLFLRMPQLAQGESRVQYSTAQHSTAQHSTARPAVLCLCSKQRRAASCSACSAVPHRAAPPCSAVQPCGQSRTCRASGTIHPSYYVYYVSSWDADYVILCTLLVKSGYTSRIKPALQSMYPTGHQAALLPGCRCPVRAC